MAPALYRFGQVLARVGIFNSLHVRILHPRAMRRQGGYILACSHLSHVEPFLLSALMPRRIDWMARMEFYRLKFYAMLLDCIDAFSVNRQGVPVRAIRTAIARVRSGRVLGIFPEGGVVTGAESVCRGGAIKRGACLVACAAGTPIVPVVMLGTHELNRIGVWIPWRRGRIWVAFGEPIEPRNPPPGPSGARQRRLQRQEMAEELRQAFMRLYAELLQKYGLQDAKFP